MKRFEKSELDSETDGKKKEILDKLFRVKIEKF